MASNMTFTSFLQAFPRAFYGASEFTFSYVPDQLDNFMAMIRDPGKLMNNGRLPLVQPRDWNGRDLADYVHPPSTMTSLTSHHVGSVIADATSKSRVSNVTKTIMPGVIPTTAAKAVAITDNWLKRFGIEHFNGFDGIFGYFFSRWAVSTIFIAIILNRARMYSSSRRRLCLNWYSRLLLRILPIILFLLQIRTILQTMRCQTSSLLPVANPPDGSKIWNGAFAHEGGPVYWLSSTLLFWQTEELSCAAAQMLPMEGRIPAGSSSVLWPLFMCLCLSHLLETMSCALEGRVPVPETAMSLFEHSLAFAEAEAVVRGTIGLGLFGPIKSTAGHAESNAHFAALTRSMVLQRLNVPPEVLLIAFISSCSHLSNHILGVFGLQSRFRLINTTIWGLSFISAFIWSFAKFAYTSGSANPTILRYPTVCIIGFIPHLLILVSSIACACIYGIALLITVLSPPTRDLMQISWSDSFRLAHDNLQASTAMAPLSIKASDEFYTTLLKFGYNLLTAASEAVYFNEGIAVAVSRSTWLEEKRLAELTAHAYLLDFRQQSQHPRLPPELTTDEGVAEGLNMVDHAKNPATSPRQKISGYAREKTAAKLSSPLGQAATQEDGVGGSQRSGRWYMTTLLYKEHLRLIARLMAKVFVSVMNKVYPPLLSHSIIVFAYPIDYQTRKLEMQHESTLFKTKDFWVLSDDGTSHLASDASVDVESEVRKRFACVGLSLTADSGGVDEYLYSWWRQGGFWGEVDSSDDYQPSILDDIDITSVISEDDPQAESNSNSESDDALSSGQRTPTQDRPFFSRDQSPATDNMFANLSALLDPTTLEQKHEARMLSSRLRRRGPTTRAQFARDHNQNTLRLLSGRPDLIHDDKTMTPEQEEDVLEKILFARRREAQTATQVTSWNEGGDGMGSDGPQCVVCHSTPRTILLWPCRCLCLCEDCRVSMALNNFRTCVTCRRDVVAFSRLYVP